MRQVRHFIQDWPLRNHIGQRYGSSKRISAAHHQYQQRAKDSQCGPPPPKAQQQASRRQHADQKVARPCSCPRSGRPYSFIGLWRVPRRPRQNSHTHDGIWPPDKREPSCSPCPADSVTPTRTLGVSFLKVPLWIEPCLFHSMLPSNWLMNSNWDLQGSPVLSCSLLVYLCAKGCTCFVLLLFLNQPMATRLMHRKRIHRVAPLTNKFKCKFQWAPPWSLSLSLLLGVLWGTLGNFNYLHVNRWQWPGEIFNCPWSLKPQI